MHTDFDTPKQILIAAQESIRNPLMWCQHLLVDRAGRVCAVGAVTRAGLGDPMALRTWYSFEPDGDTPTQVAIRLLYRAAEQIGAPPYVPGANPAASINNTGSHADVMKMFDRAIELAEAAEISVELSDIRLDDAAPPQQPTPSARTRRVRDVLAAVCSVFL